MSAGPGTTRRESAVPLVLLIAAVLAGGALGAGWATTKAEAAEPAKYLCPECGHTMRPSRSP